jgi:hypothetical protein
MDRHVRVLRESFNLSQGFFRETTDADKLLEGRAVISQSTDGVIEPIHLQDWETCSDSIKVKSWKRNGLVGAQETSKMGSLFIRELGEHDKKPVGFT